MLSKIVITVMSSMRVSRLRLCVVVGVTISPKCSICDISQCDHGPTKISSYVARMRRVQDFKESDVNRKGHDQLLSKGEFLVMADGEQPKIVALQSSEMKLERRQSVPEQKRLGHRRRLATCTYEGLQSSFKFDPSSIASESVFLDFRSDDCAPRFAIAVPSIRNSKNSESVVRSPETDDLRRAAGDERGATASHFDNVLAEEVAHFCNPRVAIFVLSKDEANLVSHAISLLRWHRTFKYCPRCGLELTQRNAAGTQKRCSGCQQIHYPQLSPVAITLLTNPDRDRCLLVRQPRFVNGMFTAVAGYIEAGETLEETVRREIAEEVGLDVIGQRYLRLSQHWPFPTPTLMLGSVAIVDPVQTINLDGKELEAARWFNRSEIQEAVERADVDPYLRIRNEGNLIFVPPRGAIAYDLVQHFLRNNFDDLNFFQ